MTMYDPGGLAGAQMVGTQLEIYRWGDHFRRMRENEQFSELQFRRFSEADMRGRYNGLVCDYNKLLGEAKWLFGECTRISDEAGRRGQRIAELEQELAELRAAKAKSDEKVMNYAAERANRVMSGLQ